MDVPLHARSRPPREHVDSRGDYDELPRAGCSKSASRRDSSAGSPWSFPIVIWDWARSSHRALELPMAVTAWLFGLVHFSRDSRTSGGRSCSAARPRGLLGRERSRVHGSRRPSLPGVSPAWTIVAGAAWSFVSFIFFWYMLLPVARDGAPFRAPAFDPLLSTAPNWVWILGFTLSGLVSPSATRRSALAVVA